MIHPTRRGATVEVFDVGDAAGPMWIGEYDAQLTLPWSFMTPYGSRVLIPGGQGFEVYEITALEAP